MSGLDGMFPFMWVLEGEIDVPFYEGLVNDAHEVEQNDTRGLVSSYF